MSDDQRTDRYLSREWTVPLISDVNREFFTSGRLRIQRCRNCHQDQHPPLDICASCQSFDLDYVTFTSYGVVAAATTVHHSSHQQLKESVPYNVVVVALDDNPSIRVVGNVIDARPGQELIGTRVHCTWAPAEVDLPEAASVLLPQWRIVDD